MAATEILSGVFLRLRYDLRKAFARRTRAFAGRFFFSFFRGTAGDHRETGSGKTMLALSILGLLPANVRMQSGCIQMDGAALPAGKQLQTLRGDKLVYIPQNGAEFCSPRARCESSSMTA